jgi:hypothetical protein
MKSSFKKQGKKIKETPPFKNVDTECNLDIIKDEDGLTLLEYMAKRFGKSVEEYTQFTKNEMFHNKP